MVDSAELALGSHKDRGESAKWCCRSTIIRGLEEFLHVDYPAEAHSPAELSLGSFAMQRPARAAGGAAESIAEERR